MEPLDINGDPPALTGLPCDELFIQQSWYRGELVAPASVVYLRFAGERHRLYFDAGIVFWRPHDQAPEAVPPTEEGYAWPLVDLGRQFGFRGVVLDRIEAAPVEGALVSRRVVGGVPRCRRPHDVPRRTRRCSRRRGHDGFPRVIAHLAPPAAELDRSAAEGLRVGHPANVVLHDAHPHHPSVSPIVYCPWGAETLLSDLNDILRERPSSGVSELAVSLAVRWVQVYGRGEVAVWNLDTPGLRDGANLADSYPAHMAFVRRKVETDPQWFAVDLTEYQVRNMHGVWPLLDEPEQPVPGNAPDPAGA